MKFLYKGKLNDLDRVIAERVEANPEYFIDHNIFDSADYLGVSASKLTKYCQKIGLNGYKELKYKLQTIHRQNKYLSSTDSDTNYTILSKFLNDESLANLYTVPLLIQQSRRIIILSQPENQDIGIYLSKKIREISGKDVFYHSLQSNFEFEYATNRVLTIVLEDETESISQQKLETIAEFGSHVIHIGSEMHQLEAEYTPIQVIAQGHTIPYDAKVFTIVSWISNCQLFL